MQQIDREMEATNEEEYEKDFTDFLEDLEEDREYRKNVNIYHGGFVVIVIQLRKGDWDLGGRGSKWQVKLILHIRLA